MENRVPFTQDNIFLLFYVFSYTVILLIIILYPEKLDIQAGLLPVH